jgi:hypothetical protein
MRSVEVAIAIVASHVLACGNSTSHFSPPTPDASGPVRGCTPPDGASGAPKDVGELVTLVNALGAARSFPVELTCVLESLDRPLGFLASRSPFSLQATTDTRSPRFFLFSGTLVMTAVPVGDGRHLLELGYQISETRSIKAEIAFPVTEPLAPAQPYEHLLHDTVTSCGTCHGYEEPAPLPATPKAFSSVIFKPLKTQEVDLAFLRDQFLTCDALADAERCAIFSAVFGHGPLEPRAFSDKARTIYDN